MAGSDVKAKRLTGTGSAGVGPARIRQVQIKTDIRTRGTLIVDFNRNDILSRNEIGGG